MKIEKFEDILAWQKAKIITLRIYKIFKECSDFGFKNQIQRASISIMNNIAEGFERKSDKELKQYLFIAKGSAGEVRSMLSIAYELKYLSKEDFNELNNLILTISKFLANFIKSLD